MARQPVTLQAFPNVGQNFYAWFNIPVFSFSRNPQIFRWDLDVPNAAIDVQAGFSDQPTYIFTTNPLDKRLGVYVDGIFYYAPVNYSPFYDGATWNAGTMHTINTDSPQAPFDYGTRHQFQNWNDAGAQSHSITLPAVNTVYTASFDTQYRALVASPCGGTPSISPGAVTDGFFNAGTPITLSQTPGAGFVFTGWGEDLTGTVSPQMFALNDELYAVANYNVNSTPFSITSISPSSAVQNSAGFTLTINGTGFTNDQTSVFVNDQFRANAFVNSTQITVPVLASDLTTPGGISIFVQNFPNGATCGVYNNRVLDVKIPFSPTAAAVSIGGRVLTATGRGIFGARVALTGANGNARSALTNAFGYYRFTEVPVGETYIIDARHKSYSFAPQVINLTEDVRDLNITSMVSEQFLEEIEQ